MKYFKWMFTILVALFLWGCVSGKPFAPVEYTPQEMTYSPTEGFRQSTPEEQGMDSAILQKMIIFYEKEQEKNKEVDIDSIHIIRNGYLVADLYFDPLYPQDYPHIIHSCTKSIMSALIGIAIDKGYIQGVDQQVVSFFPKKNQTSMDPRIDELTIKDLLTMETGMRSLDSFLFGYTGIFEIQKSDDWVQYFLNLPIDVEPGIRFDYSNLSSFMLSAIIMKSTGQDTLSFAYQNLFDPLGITDVTWENNPQGIGIGWARMWLKPHDMAKFGMLYLQKGKWGNVQLISESWIEDSLTANAFPKEYHDVLNAEGIKDNELSKNKWVGYNLFKPFTDGYGYQWWLDKSGEYTALGTGGQFIIVSPLNNLVVVITSQSQGLGSFFPSELYSKYIKNAVKSDSPLAENEEALNYLMLYQNPPEIELEHKQVQTYPDVTTEVSGILYKLNENNWDYDNFTFDFLSDSNSVILSYTTGDSGIISYSVGLDNLYHFTDTEKGRYAAKGHWIDESTFEISYQLIGYSVPGTWVITFLDNEIQIIERGVTGEYEYSG
ncbi:MAG: serine hydrolase [Spirochaetales bacterium]|nr:serine hydrolase [Spirochaetales bacterium]